MKADEDWSHVTGDEHHAVAMKLLMYESCGRCKHELITFVIDTPIPIVDSTNPRALFHCIISG